MSANTPTATAGISGGAGAKDGEGVTHAALVDRAARWLRSVKRCPVVATEIVTSTEYGECPDAIGWYKGWSFLVECKVSREDYYADRQKPFRRNPERGLGDFRYFMTPPGLLVVKNLPEGWGLLETHGRSVRVVRESGDPPHPWRPPTFAANHRDEKRLLIAIARRTAGEYECLPNRTTVTVEPYPAGRHPKSERPESPPTGTAHSQALTDLGET